MKTTTADNGDHYLVNNRYAIYKDDGCIYDTIAAKDIPQPVFALRDRLLPQHAV